MKARFLMATMMAGMMAVSLAACSDNDADDPTDPDVPPTPPTEQVEPLTDELRPILTEGKRWIVEYGRVGGTNKTKYTCQIAGEETKKGLPAKIVKIQYTESGEFLDEDFDKVMREENGVVYKLCQVQDPYSVPEDEIESTQEFVLSCNVVPDHSETYECYGYGTTIISRGTIVLQGKTRRAVKVWSNGHFFIDYPGVDPYDYWVEGIGSLLGQMPDKNYVYPSTATENWRGRYRLLECYDGDEKIYDYREFTPELYTEEEVFTDIDRQQ